MRAIIRALPVALASILVLAPAVLAAQPTLERTPVDDSLVIPAGARCSFEIHASLTGILTTKTWTDDGGTIVRQTFAWNGAKIEWVNASNGHTMTTLLAGPAIYEPLGDGTVLVTVPGNDQAVVMPGEGFLAGRTGLSRTIQDEVTGAVLEVLQLSGHQTSPWPAGCLALA